MVPGKRMYGRDLGNGTKLPYLCNGYGCYYISLALLALAHFTGVFKLTEIVDNFGSYLTTSILVGDAMSLYWYWFGLRTGQAVRMSGSVVYDFFMGSMLYPRVFGVVDIKMVAECRWSWLTLFLITASAALKQYEVEGVLSPSMVLMVLAHWLYSNATVKGEQYVTLMGGKFENGWRAKHALRCTALRWRARVAVPFSKLGRHSVLRPRSKTRLQ